MRRILWSVCAISFFGTGLAQSPASRDVHLVGNRFKPLQYEEMTPEQKKFIDHLLAGERHNLGGPFNVLARSPEMGDLAQEFGAHLRFHAALPPEVKELVIIMTARFWTAQFEWSAHKRAALQAGMSPAIIQTIATGTHPESMGSELEAAYQFCSELLNTHKVTDATFVAARQKFGENGIVDMMALSGYYALVSMALNVDEYPLSNTAEPELKPIRKVLP
jgi:4-carboxymuconolactone decarboxylase